MLCPIWYHFYNLKCNMCDHKETYIGKTVGDNGVGFKDRINQRMSDCRSIDCISTCKFPVQAYLCAVKNKYLKEPYFQLNIMVKLKDSRQLQVYENHFHKKGYDTINCMYNNI